MNSLNKSLIAVEVAHSTDGWFFINEALKSSNSSLEVLEATHLPSGRFFILINGETGDVSRIAETQLFKVFSASAIDVVVLKKYAPALLTAIFSLSKATATESLLVLECHSACRLIALAQFAIEIESIEVIDLRLGRGTGGVAVGYLTGKIDKIQECSKMLLKTFSDDQKPEWHSQILHPLHPTLLNFF